MHASRLRVKKEKFQNSFLLLARFPWLWKSLTVVRCKKFEMLSLWFACAKIGRKAKGRQRRPPINLVSVVITYSIHHTHISKQGRRKKEEKNGHKYWCISLCFSPTLVFDIGNFLLLSPVCAYHHNNGECFLHLISKNAEGKRRRVCTFGGWKGT